MTATPLRILIVSPSLPYPPTWGFGIRVFQFVRHLAARNYVRVLCYPREVDDGERKALAQICDGVQVVTTPPVGSQHRRASQLASLPSTTPFHAREHWSAAMQAAIDACLTEWHPDIIQVESSPMCAFSYRSHAPVVLDEHNIESELLGRMGDAEGTLLRRAYRGIEAAKYRRFETRAWRRASACLVTSAREADVVRTRASSVATHVVPNGVDCGMFRPTDEPDRSEKVVFVGLLTYRPNLDAALYLADEVMPVVWQRNPNVSLTIVGAGLPADLRRLDRPGVKTTGWVPDTREYLSSAGVAVVPVRMGGGTRLKVLEALAMGTPVVTTTVGSEGIDVEDGRHLLVADGADAFAHSILRLLGDRDLAQRLSREGRQLVIERYSWTEILESVENLYYELARARASVSTPRAGKAAGAS